MTDNHSHHIQLGADIIEIDRIKNLLAKRKNFLRRVFTENEIAYYIKRGSKAETLAGIFACKEAMVKANGGRIGQYEVMHYENGKPYVNTDGSEVCVTITHNKTTAAAFVCVWR